MNNGSNGKRINKGEYSFFKKHYLEFWSVFLLMIIVLSLLKTYFSNFCFYKNTVFGINSSEITLIVFLIVEIIFFINAHKISHFAGTITFTIFIYFLVNICLTNDSLNNFFGIFTIFLVSIYIYKSDFARRLKSKLQNSPDNFIRRIATEQEYFILAIAIAIIALIGLSVSMNHFPFTKLGSSILDISFTLIAGFFSVLIYFKIEDKTKSLSDYMNKFIKIVGDARDGDTIYIIGPTLFVGQEFHQNLHKKYKQCLFGKIGRVRFVIANLNFNETKMSQDIGDGSKNQKQIAMDNWVLSIESCREQSPIIKPRKFFKEQYEQIEEAIGGFGNLIEGYSNRNPGLFYFHEIYVPFRADNIDQESLERNIKHHCNLIKFYIELIERINTDNNYEANNLIIKHLNWDYYYHPKTSIGNETAINHSNFFAVANITQGDYYIGQFIVNSNKVHEFHGSSFRNENISEQMQQMLDGFITKYEYNESTTP